jgi:tyrosyl-tRNA synthetase
MSEPRPIPPAEEQIEVIARGTVDLTERAELLRRLDESHQQQRPLVVKTGFDPTAPDLHLGHMVVIEKMAQFQRLGHDVVFLVGDYTAMIGDPTGRNTLRPPLTEAAIRENARTYTEQCFKLLDRQRTRIEWNSSWLSRLDFREVITLASRFNLGRMLERRDFKERLQEGRQIAMHELLYPLVQGYDSVQLRADIELGGADQIFNLNVGRHLMSCYDQRPQMVLTLPLLVGLDGSEKMSKSKGNHVAILDEPDTMFGKIMSISDTLMAQWYPLLLGRGLGEAQPLQGKKALAAAMVERFWGPAAARDTMDWWNADRPPRNVERREVAPGPLFKLVHAAGGAQSGSDAQRKIKGGGVYLDGTRQQDPSAVIAPGDYQLRVGKLFVVQLHVQQPPE